MKHGKWLLIGFAILFSIAGILFVSAEDRLSLFQHEHPGLIADDESLMRETISPLLFGADEDLVLVEDGTYQYYLNKEGIPEYILAKDPKSLLRYDKELPGIDVQAIKPLAEEWFRDVFPDAVQSPKRSLETVVNDFNGGTYLATVRLLEEGIDTGYTASLSFTADGILLVSTFIKGEDTVTPPELTEDEAFQLAREALEAECRQLYGKDILLDWDQIHSAENTYRVFKGSHFWEVSFTVPTHHMGPWEGYELYAEIRIDAATGACLSIATPLK